MGFAFSKQSHQRIGPSHFFAARALNVDNGALDNAVKACCRAGFFKIFNHEALKIIIEILYNVCFKRLNINITGRYNRRSITIIEQGEQEMLQRSQFMLAVRRIGQCAVDGFFEYRRKRRHIIFLSIPPSAYLKGGVKLILFQVYTAKDAGFASPRP